MINTLYSNLRPPDGSAPVLLTIGHSAQSGILHVVVDCATVYNRGELAGIELEVTTGVVAPGASKDLTVFYAFSSKDNRTPTQLATAAASQACTMPNAAATIRSYALPIVYQGARYLHIWFDSVAMDAGSLLTLDLRVNAKVAN